MAVGETVQGDESSMFWANVVGAGRTSITIAAMGFKITTMGAQLAGITASAEIVPAKYLMKGVRKSFPNTRAAFRFAAERSAMMRDRPRNMDYDLRRAFKEIASRKHLQRLGKLQRFAMQGIVGFDLSVSIPTWIGMYEYALDQGFGADKAVKLADEAVIKSQGGGGIKDTSGVQRTTVLRPFVMFYSYFAALYSRLRDIGRDAKTSGQEGKLLSPDVLWKLLYRSMMAWYIPAIFSELLAGRGPEDDEDYKTWALKKVVFYPFLTIPGVKDVAASFDSGYAPSVSPMGRLWNLVYRTGNEGWELFTGEGSIEEFVPEASETVATLIGLPVGQAKITGGYLWDIYTGEEDPENAVEFLRNLAFHRKED